MSSCWYCRKGGLVDLYFTGRTGVCPGCGKGVNVKFDAERFMTLDTILTGVEEWAKSTGSGGSGTNEPLTLAQLKALPDGTKVYCYKLVDGKLQPDEWEVCRTKSGDRLMRSGGLLLLASIAIDSKSNDSNRRCFLKEVDLNGGNSGNSGNGSQREYNVGDHVIIERSNIDGGNGGRWNFAGKTGVIVEVLSSREEYRYRVKVDGDGCRIYCDIKCLADSDPWEELPF